MVDAYGEYEQLTAFETYMGDVLDVPFKAVWRDPDEPGHAERIKVLGVISGADERKGVMLSVERKGKPRRVEADQVWVDDLNDRNAIILSDYRAWWQINGAYL